MNEIEEKLFKALEEVVSTKGMRVVNINISNSSSSPSIKIIIDAARGIGVDDCSFTSRLADDLIKINGYFDDYDIEVSSPGINRQLFSVTDFMLYKGFIVKIKLKSGKYLNFFSPNYLIDLLVRDFFKKEPETLQWIDNFKKEEKIIFWDIGSNIGLYTIYAAAIIDNIEVISFEPSTSNLRVLSRNISINHLENKIKIFQIPVGIN